MKRVFSFMTADMKYSGTVEIDGPDDDLGPLDYLNALDDPRNPLILNQLYPPEEVSRGRVVA